MVDWNKIKETQKQREEEEFGPRSERNTKGLSKMILGVLIVLGIIFLFGWWNNFGQY